MWSSAIVRCGDGEPVELGHGDLVGRLWSARLRIDDPRVSEAHAMVSLRGRELKLLALRGRFAVDGRAVQEVTLRAGLEVTLADGLVMVVDAVEVPAWILGLSAPGMADRALPGTCALVTEPVPVLAPPNHPGAAGHVWRFEDGWRARAVGQAARDLVPGVELEAGGVVWRGVRVALAPDRAVTLVDPSLSQPLQLVVEHATARIVRHGLPDVVLQGLPARLLTELVAFDGPVLWNVLAGELWPDGGSRKQLDMVVVRLRQRLREHRVRTDLVNASGTGWYQLLLQAGDSVDDRS